MAAVGAKNKRLADVAGVHVKTVSYWLSDAQVPDAEALDAVAADLGVTSAWLRYGAPDRVTERQPAGYVSDRQAVYEARKKLRPKPYERVYGYLELMHDVGVPEEAIEEAERYLVESNFGKINKLDYRQRNDDEVIGDIDEMWKAIKIRFERDYGVTL